MFKHFLTTSFNLVLAYIPFDKEEWINWTENRIQIFKRYCLPSILNQSNSDFLWLIYFDIQTPAKFEPFIKELDAYENIMTIKINGWTNLVEQNKKDVIRLSEGKPWIISSRIDNDDALHNNAIEDIQKNFIKKDKQLIALSSGYIYDIKMNKLAHHYYFNSPFLSIIEKGDKESLQGIFSHAHTQWPNSQVATIDIFRKIFGKRNSNSVIYLMDYPYWVQTIQNNLGNTFYRGFPLLKNKKLSDYSLNVISNKESPYFIYKYYNFHSWKQYLLAKIYKKWHKK